jgi:hypothetical protein
MVLNKTTNKPSMLELYKWTSIRKAEELKTLFTVSNNYIGTQKSVAFGGKLPNKKVNTGSKTSILKQKSGEGDNKSKENSEINIATIKKSQKRKNHSITNQDNAESYQNIIAKDKNKLQALKVKNKSM